MVPYTYRYRVNEQVIVAMGFLLAFIIIVSSMIFVLWIVLRDHPHRRRLPCTTNQAFSIGSIQKYPERCHPGICLMGIFIRARWITWLMYNTLACMRPRGSSRRISSTVSASRARPFNTIIHTIGVPKPKGLGSQRCEYIDIAAANGIYGGSCRCSLFRRIIPTDSVRFV